MPEKETKLYESDREDELYESMKKLPGTTSMPVIIPDKVGYKHYAAKCLTKGRVVHLPVDDHLADLVPPISSFVDVADHSQPMDKSKFSKKEKSGRRNSYLQMVQYFCKLKKRSRKP